MKTTADHLYTYVGKVERIVDADTLTLLIDCGFGLYTNETFRLKGINAPEVGTLAGRRAKTFVEAALKEVKFVVIKSYKEDKYGRFLADIFLPSAETDPHRVALQGDYLNQKLLDEGLAQMYVSS